MQFLVENHRVVWGDSVRIEGIPGDRPHGDPTGAPIQVLRRLAPFRVECQQAETGAPSRVLDGSHQPRAEAHTATPAMYEQLRYLPTMRLVRRPGGVELDAAGNPFAIPRHEEDGTRVRGSKGPAPPPFGAFARERGEKTHGSARVDRVNQKVGESSKVGVTHREPQWLDDMCARVHGWHCRTLHPHD